MTSFVTKTIANPPTLGEQLIAAREHLGISLKLAATRTGIAAKYLGAFESGDLNGLPGDVYARSFLKTYCKFLGLHPEQMLAAYTSQRTIYAKTKGDGSAHFKKPVERVSWMHLWVTPKIVRSGIIGILVLLCLTYLGVNVKAIVTPPALTVDAPAANMATNDRFIEVSGSVGKEATVQINGQQVAVNNDSRFQETLDLQAGVNVIEVKATSRHGQETKIYRQVVVTDTTDAHTSTN